MFYEEIRIKIGLPNKHIILSIKDSLQQQIHYNGNIFGKKCCRCNEGSLYSNEYVIRHFFNQKILIFLFLLHEKIWVLIRSTLDRVLLKIQHYAFLENRVTYYIDN